MHSNTYVLSRILHIPAFLLLDPHALYELAEIFHLAHKYAEHTHTQEEHSVKTTKKETLVMK